MKLSVNQEPQAIFWKASSWTGKSVGPYQFNVCFFWQIIISEWCYCSPQTAPHLLDQSSLAAWPFSWSDTSGTMSSVWGGVRHVVNTYSYARLFINLLPTSLVTTSWALSALLDSLGYLKWMCLVSLCLAFLERSLEVLKVQFDLGSSSV